MMKDFRYNAFFRFFFLLYCRILKFCRVGLHCVHVMGESGPFRDTYQALPLPPRSSVISVALVKKLEI